MSWLPVQSVTTVDFNFYNLYLYQVQFRGGNYDLNLEWIPSQNELDINLK